MPSVSTATVNYFQLGLENEITALKTVISRRHCPSQTAAIQPRKFFRDGHEKISRRSADTYKESIQCTAPAVWRPVEVTVYSSVYLDLPLSQPPEPTTLTGGIRVARRSKGIFKLILHRFDY